MANKEIRNKFFELLNNSINTQVANTYKNDLRENSFYKYAINNNARIEFLKNQLNFEDLPHWNPYTIKGVQYKNGVCEIIESEIQDLISEYRVNLSNYDYGEFENELDKERPYGLKSYRRLIMAVYDCLTRQIIKEMIDELQTSCKPYKQDYNRLIFDTPNSENFFKHLVDEWIQIENNKKTALSFVFHRMWYKTDFRNENHKKYSIISTSTNFAEYWNENYSNILDLDIKNPKFKKDITKRYYYTSFNFHLDEFEKKGVIGD